MSKYCDVKFLKIVSVFTSLRFGRNCSADRLFHVACLPLKASTQHISILLIHTATFLFDTG